MSDTLRTRAYLSIQRRLPECDTSKLRKASDRLAFERFSARINAAVDADPTESAPPIDVPWDEWDAYTIALDDTSGG